MKQRRKSPPATPQQMHGFPPPSINSDDFSIAHTPPLPAGSPVEGLLPAGSPEVGEGIQIRLYYMDLETDGDGYPVVEWEKSEVRET